MTALPLRDFTDAERAKLEAIEAASAAEESARERVARALWEAEPFPRSYGWDDLSQDAQRGYRRYADAALAVLSGPSSDAEQAVERCLWLADYVSRPLLSERETGQISERTRAFMDVAKLIRRAVAGDPC